MAGLTLFGIAIPLSYRTTKMIKVDYWQLGLLYWLLCLLVVLSYGFGIFNSGEYLLTVPIVGRVNPYVQQSSHPAFTCLDNGDCATVHNNLVNDAAYCAAADHYYYFDRDFKYYSGAEEDRVGPE